MNERAAALGCSSTNFVTPSGLPAEGHVSTATDLAVISKAALDNETVRKIAGTTEHTIPATNMYQERQLKNFNMFLDGGEREVDGQVMTVEKYEGVFGGKTGSPQQRVLYYGHRPGLRRDRSLYGDNGDRYGLQIRRYEDSDGLCQG